MMLENAKGARIDAQTGRQSAKAGRLMRPEVNPFSNASFYFSSGVRKPNCVLHFCPKDRD
jgi:hypothetical protein